MLDVIFLIYINTIVIVIMSFFIVDGDNGVALLTITGCFMYKKLNFLRKLSSHRALSAFKKAFSGLTLLIATTVPAWAGGLNSAVAHLLTEFHAAGELFLVFIFFTGIYLVYKGIKGGHDEMDDERGGSGKPGKHFMKVGIGVIFVIFPVVLAILAATANSGSTGNKAITAVGLQAP